MNHFFSSLVLVAGLVAATACSKKEEATPTPAPVLSVVSGTLSGAQEVPAVTTSATGTVSGTYDKAKMELKYSVTFSGLTPTAGHFHAGTPGTTGPVSLAFTFNNAAGNGFVSPITGTVTLTAAQNTAILGNSFYANLHSTTVPSGEIRADVTVK